MAGDNVKLKIGADTSELEKAFGALIKKIQNDADKLKLTTGAAKGIPGVESFRENFRIASAKAQERTADQAALNIANSALAAKNREIEKLARQQKGITNDKKAEAYYENEINKALKERQRLQETAIQLQRNIGGAAGNGGRNLGVGGNFGNRGITSLSGLASILGVPASIFGGIASAVALSKGIETTRRFISESSLRAREAESSAFNIQGQAGQLLSNTFQGGAAENIIFSSQRAQAANIAQSTIQSRYSNRANDKLLNWMFGSDTLGAFQHGQIAQGLRALGGHFGNQGLQKEFESNKQMEQANIQAKQEEALEQGPGGKIRTEVSNKYLSDWRRNLDFERQTGQSENEFRNFLGIVNRAGFQDELGMGAASAILGAGGSTRAAVGNAAFALQMGRQFDLTNAGQAIGAISGQLGGTQQSKDALIAIQAEGTRIGLNRSDMREENRKFVEMAANVINQSNTTSAAGVDQVLDTLTKFMSGNSTVSGLQAGQSAYEMYQRQSNIQSGPSAVMRLAGMRKDTTLGQLTERQRGILSTMPELEITPDSLVIQSMAGGDPKKAQAIVDSMHKIIGQSLFVNPTTDEAINRLRKARGAMMGPLAPGETFRGRQRALDLARGAAAGELTMEQMGGNATEKQRLAIVDALSAGDFRGLAQLQDDVKKQAESRGMPRPGDEMEKQQAEASRMANELFLSIQKSIEPAATVTAQFTANINALVVAMRGGNADAIANAQKNLYNFNTTTTQQPHDQTHATSGGPPSMSVEQIRDYWKQQH